MKSHGPARNTSGAVTIFLFTDLAGWLREVAMPVCVPAVPVHAWGSGSFPFGRTLEKQILAKAG